MPGDKINENQTPVKSKLLELRKWLTVSEAAKHMSLVFGEQLNKADILRFALDGQLKLSVNFVNPAHAKCGEIALYEDTGREEFPSELATDIPNIPGEAKGKPVHAMKSFNIDDDRYINLKENVTTIKGVWDLCMIGDEKLDVERKYQNLTGGPAIIRESLAGAFVEKENGQVCQLQESFDNNEYMEGSKAELRAITRNMNKNIIDGIYGRVLLKQNAEKRKQYFQKRAKKNYTDDFYPTGGLPSDSVLVVRASALIDLLKRFLFEESDTNNIEENFEAEQKRELGRLRNEKSKWDDSIKASVEIGMLCKELSDNDQYISRERLFDEITELNYKLPDATIQKIWKAIPEKIRRKSGRPKKTQNN